MKIASTFLATLLLSISIFAQISNWANYSDMKNVTSIAATDNGTWAATSGGGFFFNSTDSSFTKINKVDGLNSNSLSAVTIDNFGKIWFGSDNGTINIYDPANKQVKTILDIFNSNATNKRINSLGIAGDTIIVSHDFGVSLINAKNLVFFDTFFKFGNLPSNIKVNSVLHSNLIYVCTQLGLGIQKAGTINLSAPDSWSIYTTSEGLPSNNISRVVKFNGNIIAATDVGLSLFNGSTWSEFLPQFNNQDVKDIIVNGDSLIILANNVISSYKTGVITLASSSAELINIGYSKNIGLLASSSGGIFNLANTNNLLYPNGPQANQFPSMVVDGAGNLWSASGRDVSGVGFYKFDGGSWTNYYTSNTPELTNNAFHVVYSAPDNSIYFGSWGKGFTKYSGTTITNYYTTGTGMVGIPASPDFLVISGFSVDSKNNLWVLNYWPGDGNSLSVLSPEGTWFHLKVPAESGFILEQHFNLVIDPNGTKWYSVLDSKKAGLYFFNEKGTLSNLNDDISGYFNSSNGLNSNLISSVVVDKRGELWVGTSSGVNVVSNISGLVTQNGGSPRISSVFVLRQQTVNCIAVDALNQKWIGTNEGLLYVNSDGTSLLNILNTKNSALLSNTITSLAIDENTGTVYAGTEEGITAFKTSAEKPQNEFTSLFVYPNPFRLQNSSGQLAIKGLVKDSDIKILSISGNLIRELSSPGGNVAYWDGRDEKGNLVGTGIYLIIAYDEDGNNAVAGKVAVFHD